MPLDSSPCSSALAFFLRWSQRYASRLLGGLLSLPLSKRHPNLIKAGG
ncbi:hypothetical protein SynMINOS11_01583 [Synechococcus sp. Minos11]|nr:hypothetical protein SynMINOS11_01583 [Synechococcus sp. Minos11]